uniref:Small ribosomal subunit protein uS9c n=1 Tax=Euglena archaeoplastidiata TaxID=1188008 RepID=A0A1X9GCM9_9EUGL|nr:ribosomal protein S9 [Euglena archaeoplastidiata]AKR17897.1 ribosomal protein S9 [Euglena archaeoplastidiata]
MKEQSIGRMRKLKRKESIATVRLLNGNGKIFINGRDFTEYLQNNPKKNKSNKIPLLLLELDKNYDTIITCVGGGLTGQAEAIKLGIARALLKIVSDTDQKKLKTNGMLSRNSLCKERRKYGLKKARKAPQFSKR